MQRFVVETDEETKNKLRELAYRKKTTKKFIFKVAIDLLAKKEGIS